MHFGGGIVLDGRKQSGRKSGVVGLWCGWIWSVVRDTMRAFNLLNLLTSRFVFIWLLSLLRMVDLIKEGP